jgi:hypothetical protein
MILMLKRLLRWLTPLLILFSLWLPVALAQRQRGVQTEEVETSRSFPFAYTIALLGTMLVMVIVCAPSRKSWRG